MSETTDSAVVVEYSDLTHSTYPQQEDKLIVFRDPNPEEIPLINQYNAFMAQGQVASAVELLRINPSLMDCIINADKLLALHHSILSVERFFYDNVLEKIFRIGNQKGDWNELMSSDAEDEAYHLNKYDVVRYPVDGISQYFLVIGNDIETGDIPLENLDNEKYLQVSMKGDKGDAGYTPIKDVDYFDGYTPVKGVDYFDGYTPVKNVDYFDGQSGLGLTPRGAWATNTEYWQYDMVSHNGYMYYCLEDNINTEPTDDSEIWVKMKISVQVAVGTDVPSTLEQGGIWLHLQDDGRVIIKTRDDAGDYVSLHPETKASYVTDINGKSLQRWIYQNYFEREDVIVNFEDADPVFTFTATNTSGIVVARYVVTDSVLTNSQKVHEYFVYDEETGETVLYATKTTDTWDGNYKMSSVTEVIV